MSFPSNPSNGATHTIGSTSFIYNSTTNQWKGVVSTSASSAGTGGGSMGAPTHFGRFTISTGFSGAQHAGGSTFGYVGQSINGKTLTTAGISNPMISVDTGNYGTGIVLGGVVVLHPNFIANAPQFCSDAEYMASNPTFFGNSPPTFGQYYCPATGLGRITQDAGATFTPFPKTPDGTINLVNSGKYRVKVSHTCELEIQNASYTPVVHTLVFVDNVVKANYVDKAKWEQRTNDYSSGLMSRMRSEFETIIETTTANQSISVGLNKLGGGGSTTTTSSNLFVVTVESLF